MFVYKAIKTYTLKMELDHVIFHKLHVVGVGWVNLHVLFLMGILTGTFILSLLHL